MDELAAHFTLLLSQNKNLETIKRSNSLNKNHKVMKNQYSKCIHDDDGNEYMEHMSSASCYIEDIQGISFGPITSRFWLFRKHMNTLDQNDLSVMPFHAWQCITLQLHNRDVDLVIKNQKHMDMFIKFLMYELKSLDGKRGSAAKLIELIKRQKDGQELDAQDIVANRTLFKYKVIRVRLKIGFTAFVKRMTVCQLIYTSILRAHDDLVKEGSIPLYDNMLDQKIQTFEGLLNDN